MAFETSTSGSPRRPGDRVRDTLAGVRRLLDDRPPEAGPSAGNGLELASHFHRSSYGPDFLALFSEKYLGNRRNGDEQRRLKLITGPNAEKIYRKFIRTANDGERGVSKTLAKPVVFAFTVSHAGKRCVEFYKTWRENRSQRALQKKNDENIERTRRLPGHKLGFLDSEFDRMLGFLDSEFNRMSTTSLGSESVDSHTSAYTTPTAKDAPEDLTAGLPVLNASNRDSIVSNSPSVVSLRFLSDMSRTYFKPSPPHSAVTHRGPLRTLNPDGDLLPDTASSGGSIKRSSSLRSTSSIEPECGASLSSEVDETDRSSESGSAVEGASGTNTALTSMASIGHDGEFTVVLLENAKDIATIRHQAAYKASLDDGSPWWAHLADADATKYLSTSRPSTPVNSVDKLASWWSPRARTGSPSPSPTPTPYQLPVSDLPEQHIPNGSVTGSPWKTSLDVVGYPSHFSPPVVEQRLPYTPHASMIGSPAWKNYIADPEYVPTITAYNSDHFEYIGPRTTRADIPPWKHVLDGVGYPSQYP